MRPGRPTASGPFFYPSAAAMNVNFGPDFGEMMFCYALGVAALTAVVHIAFAVGVYGAAGDRPTELVAPFFWIAGTLLGGPFVAVAFWALHLSRFARPRIRDQYRDAPSYRD